MAISIEAENTAALSKLAPTFQTAVKVGIDAESTPLKRTQAQKDTLDVRKGIYTDLKNNLDGLQNALQVLISSQTTYGLNLVPKASVTSGTAGSTVLTATNTDSAAIAEYDVIVSKLAKAQSRATSAATSPDIALGKTGTFWLGGTGTSGVSDFTASSSVSAAETGSIATGRRELGQGTYEVQVRDYDGLRQFRLVNADGTAMAIQSKDGKSLTSAWQVMSDGAFDTGRGLVLTLNTSGTTGSTALTYTAKGTSVSVNANDTQRNLVSAINAAVQPEGHDFKASIVGGKLVLTGVQTGTNHAMIYTDNAGLGFGADLQAAQNAEFTVNGMLVSRATNTNLSDVVDGATINLAGDAEGKSARLSISGSSDNAAAAMNVFVTKFNATYTHLTQKMTTTSKTDAATGKTSYTRGPLASDTIFSSLRIDLYNQLNQSKTNGGSMKSLSEIGLSFDKDMKLTFDAAKFTSAIKSNGTDVKALLDTFMGKLNSTLSRHTGTTGTVQSTLSTIDGQLNNYTVRITKYKDALALRTQALINQYSQMQSQLAALGNEASMFGISLNGSSTGSSINLFS